MKAMILAAGLGTRLYPLTESRPKALVEINGVTLLEILLLKLRKSGFKQIIINVHHFANQIVDFLEANENFNLDIHLSRETELLDTGGGLKKAGWFLNGDDPFLLHNVDVISNLDLNQLFNRHTQSKAIALLAVRKRKSNRYFLSDESGNLCGWKSISPASQKLVRPPDGKVSQVSFMGVHIISPKIFSLMPAETKFSIIELYLQIASNFQIKTINCQNNSWMDLGKPENLKFAGEQFPELFKNDT